MNITKICLLLELPKTNIYLNILICLEHKTINQMNIFLVWFFKLLFWLTLFQPFRHTTAQKWNEFLLKRIWKRRVSSGELFEKVIIFHKLDMLGRLLYAFVFQLFNCIKCFYLPTYILIKMRTILLN